MKTKIYPDKTVWKGLTLSKSAMKKIYNLKKKDPSILAIRIKLKKFGCAGLGFFLEEVIKFNDNDFIFNFNKFKLCIPKNIMTSIDGTELDYVQVGLNHVFKFKNPNAKNICGCGESFNLK